VVEDIPKLSATGLPRFQTLLMTVYDHINTICAIIQRLCGKTNCDNSVWWA